MNWRKTDDILVGYAQQQFIGWQAGSTGRSVINLIKDMGLHKTEWMRLKKEEYFLPLDDLDKQEIDNYFGIKNKKRK